MDSQGIMLSLLNLNFAIESYHFHHIIMLLSQSFQLKACAVRLKLLQFKLRLDDVKY